MKVKVTITLNIPKSFKSIGPWSNEQALDDYIRHWLEEGYFNDESGYGVDLPQGIEYKGYQIKYPKEWGSES